MTATDPTPVATLTARTPEDVLAMVPVVLGFVPTASVAMLTFGAARPFHARVDLPEVRGEIPEVVDSLLGPARGHRVRRVLFVVYSDDARLSATTARALLRAFTGCGIDVVDVLRADGARWYPAVGTRPGVPPWGVPYDLSAHPFLARAVVEGRVTYDSREELRATLARDRAAIARVVGALADLTAPGPDEELWVCELVQRHVRDGTSPADREVARLLRGMLETGVRDVAWGTITRDSAREQVRFWSDVVRRGPTPMLAAPAALLAFAAWQAGHGALAWCALDRCAEADEDYPLAGLVEEALRRAVPPDAWEQE
ncbi:DUF4192 domain-containing protein [Nocardioides sp. SR21]|uniref:DUF4192 domain-containing protein n=1 Tax=Nocardioides sp. SR21 TaxID=2919501 RepID=UPI001FA9BFF5|nr:DUF4192 domain-containing protein [Nocardioides sp. SR21]